MRTASINSVQITQSMYLGCFNGIEKRCIHFRKETKAIMKYVIGLPQYTLTMDICYLDYSISPTMNIRISTSEYHLTLNSVSTGMAHAQYSLFYALL